jgi:cell division protein FtsQ
MFWQRNATTRNRRKQAGSQRRLQLPQINWKPWLPVMGVVAAALGLFMLARVALDQPLRRVAVQGRFQRVNALDIEKAVRGRVGKQGLVSVDLDSVSAAVRQLPWVDRASVARSWPNGLSVHVVEQTPVARWGESGLVNLRGELFVNDLRHIPAELPELVGPPGSEAQMTGRYLAAQGRLAEAGMQLRRLRLDERGTWEFSLDNDVLLRMGRDDVDARFDRFMATAARIVASRALEISYVDMRYANGFAIGWRSGRVEAGRGEVNRG